MKRKRNSRSCSSNTKKQITEAEEINEQMGTSILELPDPVLIDIVLRLPIKAVIMCKCVCKPWRRVISDPQFAKMHFARAEPCPLIRTIGGSRVSRMLYLIEPSEINVDYADDYFLLDEIVSMKLDTRLRIPLRNVETMLQSNTDLESSSHAGKASGLKKRCVKVIAKEQKFQIVNSCNGFLCLSDPLSNNPLVVCNPVTGEYLKLPKVDECNESSRGKVSCGFGFSNETDQYKVLRMFEGEPERCRCPITGDEFFSFLLAEVHTVGTTSWRGIGQAHKSGKMNSVTYLSGSIYWIGNECGKPKVVHSFDFNKEKFGGVKMPPLTSTWGFDSDTKMTLGMLWGGLILCTGLIDSEKVQIWVLEKNATWKKFKTIDSSWDRWPLGSYLPINFREDKGLLMFQSRKSVFLYFNPKFDLWKYFKIYHVQAKYEAVAHTPSLIMLKDVVKGDGFEILNINSKCLEFKLPGETKPIFLVQNIRKVEDVEEDEEY